MLEGPCRVYKSRWEDRLQGGRRAKGWKARPADGMAEAEGADGRAGGKLGIIGWLSCYLLVELYIRMEGIPWWPGFPEPSFM